MEAITVANVEELAKKIQDKRAEKEAKAAELAECNKELVELEQLAVRTLRELGKTSYKSEYGTITRTEKWRVNLPSTPEAREEFFAYLKEKGIFEKMITVNSNSLNAFYMQEWDASKDPNDPMASLDFRIPGIEEPKLYETMSFRKK